MTKPYGKKVNRTDLAEFFGISLSTVDAWVKAGCPFDQRPVNRGKGWVFDTADVMRWREERARMEAGGQDVQDDAALTKRRKLAETRLVELELAKAMGEVGSIDAMERVWSRLLIEFQTTMRGAFVMRCATQLLGETDERTFKRVLLSEVDSCLTSLSKMDLSEPEDGDMEDESEHPLFANANN
jgi:terminase small subunit / prophage DNA-packing protein